MEIEVIEIAANEDHVHIFMQVPPKYSFSQVANRIKGKSSRVLRKEFPQKLLEKVSSKVVPSAHASLRLA